LFFENQAFWIVSRGRIKMDLHTKNHSEREQSGMVLRIERTSIHDGEGLRTVVFLKGCPLRCIWCSTPESQHPLPERGYVREKCPRCGACLQVCPEGALSFSEDRTRIVTDKSKCQACFACLRACPSGAIKEYGSSMRVSEVLREISKDEIFYFHSGGGVTLSGGEPLEQAAFAKAILRECANRGIHRALETCLFGVWEIIESLLPWINLLYVDLKHPDSEKHRRLTGVPNELILENIKKAAASSHTFELVLRTPLIPGINDSEETLSQLADFVKDLPKIKEYEFLPYHRLGIDTYRHLGREYPLKEIKSPSFSEIAEKARIFKSKIPGISVRVKGVLLED
jgi:pyruvate formate lyase activating enzyme